MHKILIPLTILFLVCQTPLYAQKNANKSPKRFFVWDLLDNWFPTGVRKDVRTAIKTAKKNNEPLDLTRIPHTSEYLSFFMPVSKMVAEADDFKSCIRYNATTAQELDNQQVPKGYDHCVDDCELGNIVDPERAIFNLYKVARHRTSGLDADILEDIANKYLVKREKNQGYKGVRGIQSWGQENFDLLKVCFEQRQKSVQHILDSITQIYTDKLKELGIMDDNVKDLEKRLFEYNRDLIPTTTIEVSGINQNNAHELMNIDPALLNVLGKKQLKNGLLLNVLATPNVMEPEVKYDTKEFDLGDHCSPQIQRVVENSLRFYLEKYKAPFE